MVRSKKVAFVILSLVGALFSCNPINTTQPEKKVASPDQPTKPGGGSTENIIEDAGDGYLSIEVLNADALDIIEPNQSVQLTVNGFLNDQPVNEDNNFVITYKSLTENVLSVSSTGLVQAKKQGRATIAVHATAMDTEGKAYTSNIVNITFSSIGVNSPTLHGHYEQYVQRELERVRLDTKINYRQVGGKGAIWMVGVTSVNRGAEININHTKYGKGTNNMLMNWFNGSITMVGDMSAPIPLKVPIHKFQGISLGPNPQDPAIVYAPKVDEKATSITIDYETLLQNEKNENGLGSLYHASTWDRNPGDKVDLVIYIYLMVEDIDWYAKKASPNIPPLISGEGLKVDQIIPLTHLDLVLELQRFPVVLE